MHRCCTGRRGLVTAGQAARCRTAAAARRRAQQRCTSVLHSMHARAEKKQKKEQKEEAERHQRLQQELDEARSSYFTWQASRGPLCSTSSPSVTFWQGTALLAPGSLAALLQGSTLLQGTAFASTRLAGSRNGQRLQKAHGLACHPPHSCCKCCVVGSKQPCPPPGYSRAAHPPSAGVPYRPGGVRGRGPDSGSAGAAGRCGALAAGDDGAHGRGLVPFFGGLPTEALLYLNCHNSVAAGIAPWLPPCMGCPTCWQLCKPPTLCASQVAEKAAEEKKREQAGLQKERLLLEKKAKKRQADADKKASPAGVQQRHWLLVAGAGWEGWVRA